MAVYALCGVLADYEIVQLVNAATAPAGLAVRVAFLGLRRVAAGWGWLVVGAMLHGYAHALVVMMVHHYGGQQHDKRGRP